MPYIWQKGNDIENQFDKRNYKGIHDPCNKTKVSFFRSIKTFTQILMNSYVEEK